jgi:hypothetical protein
VTENELCGSCNLHRSSSSSHQQCLYWNVVISCTRNCCDVVVKTWSGQWRTLKKLRAYHRTTLTPSEMLTRWSWIPDWDCTIERHFLLGETFQRWNCLWNWATRFTPHQFSFYKIQSAQYVYQKELAYLIPYQEKLECQLIPQVLVKKSTSLLARQRMLIKKGFRCHHVTKVVVQGTESRVCIF